MSTENEAEIEVAIELEASRFLPVATFSVRLAGPDISPHDPVFGIIANMSTTGACVITNRGLPKDTMLKVSISSKTLEEGVTLPARIVWCAERLEPVREDRRLSHGGSVRHGIGKGDPKPFVDRAVSAGLVIAQRLPSATSFVSKYSSSPSCPDSAPAFTARPTSRAEP